MTLRRLLGSICRLVYSAVPQFSRGLRSTEGTKGVIVSALLGALGLFEFAYNRLAELESIWPEKKAKAHISHRFTFE